MTFELHSNLIKKDFIIDLPLNRVLLEDESYYPWILLVPRRYNIMRIMDLNQIDQLQLLKELDIAQHILWNLFELNQLNVAAIGNKTPQLHIHIIGRTDRDPAWPNTVWDHPKRQVYPREQKEALIYRLQSAFAKNDSYYSTKKSEVGAE